MTAMSTGWPIFLHIVEVPKGNLRIPTIRITVKFHTPLSPVSSTPLLTLFPPLFFIFFPLATSFSLSAACSSFPWNPSRGRIFDEADTERSPAKKEKGTTLEASYSHWSFRDVSRVSYHFSVDYLLPEEALLALDWLFQRVVRNVVVSCFLSFFFFIRACWSLFWSFLHACRQWIV